MITFFARLLRPHACTWWSLPSRMFGRTHNSTGPMREFASVRPNDAEKGCHRIFRRYGLAPRIEIDREDLAGLKKFPFIKLSSWVKSLLDSGRFTMQMCGVDCFGRMKLVLTEFWRRFRAIRPSHGLFQHTDAGEIPLECCVPFYSHTDEGRSYKHLGLWVLSAHGALGRGTRAYLASQEHRRPLYQNEMGMNYIGKTWSTQFLFATMLKTTYTKYPEAQDRLVELFAQDCEKMKMLFEWVTSSNGQQKVHMVHIGTKGDLPALQKLGKFARSFSHVPRAARARKPCPGVCHLCDAGVEGGDRAIPFEDMSPQAAWVDTLHTRVAWESIPLIVQGLPLTDALRMEFFRTDSWHNFHLGVSKHFIGSAFVAIIWVWFAIRGGRVCGGEISMVYFTLPGFLAYKGLDSIHGWDQSWNHGLPSRINMSHRTLVKRTGIYGDDALPGPFLPMLCVEQDPRPIASFHCFSLIISFHTFVQHTLAFF